MSNVSRLRKRATELEQKRQLDKALDVYIQILDESGRDLEDGDVPLYNRVGDLMMRQGKASEALGYYERAVDVYAERGYLNNAIALCNKILRQSPGRTAVYYKLGKISASKGFKSDARKNFLEYADRMQKIGNLDEAFRALKEFASLFPDQDDVRLILAEQLSKENRKGEALEQLQTLHQKLEGEGRSAEARATVDRMKAIDPTVLPRSTGASPVQKAGDLVFLDLSDAEHHPRHTAETKRPTPVAATPVQSNLPALEGLALTFVPDETSPPETATVRPVQGFESTAIPSAPDIAATRSKSGERPINGEGARTDEFDVVSDDVPDDFEVGHIAPAFRRGRGEVKEPVAQLEVEPAPEFVDLDLPEGAAPVDSSLLSGMEFAELELSDAAPHHDAPTHDLALPSALPRLEGQPAAHLAPNVAPENTPAAPGAASTATDETRAAAFPEPLSGLPQPNEHDADTTDRKAAAGDFLSAPPGFGEEMSAGPPVFPPIPGLSDDVSGDEGARAESDSKAKRPKRRLFRLWDAAGGAPPNIAKRILPPGKAGRPREPAADTDRAEESAPRVEAPLPPGFARAVDAAPKASTAARPRNEKAAGARPSAVAGAPVAAELPRSTVTLGGADAHLRQRLALDPENWTLRHRLGEALLDAGSRDEGLYELERAMVGFELSGDLNRAQEIADEIIRVAPTAVRHHQKRVEYAVRSQDRARLIHAYLELADALFRTGEGEKSVAVYSRVLELAPDDERALFALATLAPDQLTRLRAPATRPGRWSEELEIIPEVGPLVRSPTEGTVPGAVQNTASVPTAKPPARAPQPQATPEAPSVHAGADAVAPDESLIVTAETPASPDTGTPANTVDSAPPATAATKESAPVLPPHEETPTESPEAPVLNRARALTPTPVADPETGFVDLGDWLRETEPVKSTRMVVNDARPTGDERADFEELLRRFKRGVAENVDAEDFEAHYDLGVAFKEMGLIDEAIAEFQKALRGTDHRVRAYEALGQCFVEKAQYPIAAALLQRAVETAGIDDQVLVGVLYLLGFANEQMGRPADALRYYQRVFAVDLEFRDITQRVSAMEHLTK